MRASASSTENSRDEDAAEDPRLLRAVREYMAALDAGERPSRREWIKRFPEIAQELSQCLDGLAFVHSAAGRIKASESEPEMHIPEGAVAKPLGDFRLIREIGRGGMGVVYEAEQLSLGRRVAVKVLPFTAALDPRHLQRFRNEAQSAAQLHHTNIVPVYAVGCERSVHYYAMQLIEGHTLSAVIRQMGQLLGPNSATGEATTILYPWRSEGGASGPIESSSAREFMDASPAADNRITSSLASERSTNPASFYQSVAKLGQQAADALDYAHQAGIVHRDIKPANLMLDLRGNLWVTDFGLAQFYSGSELTQTGDMIGTLAYMSPEQASGKAVVLDQRTDIYSLGITLYELLTLRRAFAGGTREEILRQVCEEEPKALRLIDKGIPRELEVIIQKASAKEPSERYQSAKAFGEDLRRFLQDEPILARPPTRWERAAKWTRRHRSAALWSLTILFVLATGFAVSTVLIANEGAKTRVAERAARQAYTEERQHALEANQQKDRAERSFREARSAVDFFAGAAELEMVDKPFLTDLRREFLEHALSYYQSFLDDQQADRATETELSAAREQVSAILNELSAMENYTRLFLRTSLLGEASVRDELHLNAEQIIQCEKLTDRPQEDIIGYAHDTRTTSDERRQHYDELAKEEDASIRNILTEAQNERLQQIGWQVRGPYAFSEVPVARALGIGQTQQSEIRRLLSQFHGPAIGRRGPLGLGGPTLPDSRGSQENGADILTQVEALLTPGQLVQWHAMVGKPFRGKIRSPYLFGGPPLPFPADEVDGSIDQIPAAPSR